MGNVKSSDFIENENLFRALICSPLAILFVMLSVNSVATSGIFIFQVIFILSALYFSFNTLAYAAYYTNDHQANKADKIFQNKNLFNTVFYTPLALLFVLFAQMSLSSSANIFFKVVFVLLAMFFVYKMLSYAAFYTNDYFAEKYNSSH